MHSDAKPVYVSWFICKFGNDYIHSFDYDRNIKCIYIGKFFLVYFNNLSF